MKTTEEMVNFGQGNVEAILKSSQIFATGMQDLTKQMATATQASLQDAMNTFRALSSVRSVKDAMDLQASLARSTVEAAFRQGSHVAETSLKVAEQAMAPISHRVSVAVGTFNRTA